MMLRCAFVGAVSCTHVRIMVRCSSEPPGRVRAPSRTRRALQAQLQLAASEQRIAQLRELRAEVDKRRRLRVVARPPAWTYGIIAMNVALFVSGFLWPPFRAFCLRHCTKTALHTMCAEPYRLLSASFLHVNIGHLMSNSVALLALGGAVEALFGRAAFLAIYLSGATLGNVTSTVIARRASSTVGASGGVHALVAALLVHLRRNAAALGPRGRSTSRAICISAAIGLAFAARTPGVDAAAHVGGLFAGALSAALQAPVVTRVGSFARVRRASARRALKVAVGVLVLALVALRVAVR